MLGKYKIKGTTNTLHIVQENDPSSPREWDNLGVCAFFAPRYWFGDDHKIYVNDYNSWDEMKKAIIKDFGAAVVLPVYMYDHSGITISTKPFSCPWDSGQIGFIYATKEKVYEEYSVKRISKKIIEKVTKNLLGEIEVLDQFITGDVYGFVIKDENGNEINSCYGFFGTDIETNGILDHSGLTKDDLELI